MCNLRDLGALYGLPPVLHIRVLGVRKFFLLDFRNQRGDLVQLELRGLVHCIQHVRQRTFHLACEGLQRDRLRQLRGYLLHQRVAVVTTLVSMWCRDEETEATTSSALGKG
jgi:hypothetical protein